MRWQKAGKVDEAKAEAVLGKLREGLRPVVEDLQKLADRLKEKSRG